MVWTVIFPAAIALWSVVIGGMIGVYGKQTDPEDQTISKVYFPGIGFMPLSLLPIYFAVKSAETREQYLNDIHRNSTFDFSL